MSPDGIRKIIYIQGLKDVSYKRYICILFYVNLYYYITLLKFQEIVRPVLNMYQIYYELLCIK